MTEVLQTSIPSRPSVEGRGVCAGKGTPCAEGQLSLKRQHCPLPRRTSRADPSLPCINCHLHRVPADRREP